MDSQCTAYTLLPEEKKMTSTKMVILATFVASCGSFQTGCCGGYTSPTESAITSDLALTSSQYSVFASLLTVGAICGSLGCGQIADRFGRKWAMRISSAFAIFGWLCISLAKGTWSLDLGRLFTGIAVGMSFMVTIYVAEVAPMQLRGSLIAGCQVMMILGTSVTYLLGMMIGWRILALIGIIPSLIQIIGLIFIPESPRWLARAGRLEFQAALQSFRGKNADINQEIADIQDNVNYLALLPKRRIWDLFHRRYARPLIVGVGLMSFSCLGGGTAVLYYASEIFESAGFSSGNVGTIAMASMQVPLILLVSLLYDKIGRKPLLLCGASGTCLGAFLAGTSFLLKAHGGTRMLVLIMNLTGILVYSAFYVTGLGATPWMILSEIFDLNIKGVAAGLCAMIYWTCSWVCSYTYNSLSSWSTTGTFYIYSGMCAATILFSILLVPETKGRTLEEIQMAMGSIGCCDSNNDQ